MPKIRFPQDAKWRGMAPTDFTGTTWLTCKLDLHRVPGKITLGDSFDEVIDSADDTDLGLPVAFIRTAADNTDKWWALAGAVLFKSTNTDPESAWAQDAVATSPTDAENDMVEVADALIVSRDVRLTRLAAGTWTANWWGTGGTVGADMTGSPHRFAILAGTLLITDGRFINTWDGTTATDPALTLPADQQMDWIQTAGELCFMAGQGVGGSTLADVFFWDGIADTYNARHSSGDIRVFAGFTANGIPHIVTRKGEVKRYTGQGFRTIATFPAYESNIVITDLNPNGITVDKNIVKMLVRFGATTGTGFGLQSWRVLDGIYTFDSDTGELYHSGALRNTATNDFGQLEMVGVGALVQTNPTQGKYLIGGQLYTVYTGTTRYGIFTSAEESTSNRGYLITPKIASTDVGLFLRRLIAKFKRLDTSTDRIRLLMRTRDSNTLPAYETITWVNATSYTADNANVAANDFVEILAGANAGALVKISSIVAGSPDTHTLESLRLNASTAAARARYLPWRDVSTISSQALQSTIHNIVRRSEWVQFCIELRGTETSPHFDNLILDFDPLPVAYA